MSIICTPAKWPAKPETGQSLAWQKVFHHTELTSLVVLSHREIASGALKGTAAEESVAAGDSASDGMTLAAAAEALIETT